LAQFVANMIVVGNIGGVHTYQLFSVCCIALLATAVFVLLSLVWVCGY
jgi:hypothetical protein